MENQLTFLSAERPANPSQSQDSEKEWTIRVATWRSSFLRFLTTFAPVGWSGRTCPGSCHRAKDGTLAPSSEGWGNSGMGSPTEFLTLNTSEFPKGRRRVFVVGYFGDWRPAAAVLFERSSVSGDSAPSRKAREGAASDAAKCLKSRGGLSHREDAETYVTMSGEDVSPSPSSRLETATGGTQDAAIIGVTHALPASHDASEDGCGRGVPLVPIAFSAKDHGADAAKDVSPTLRAGGSDKSHPNSGNWMAVAFTQNQQGDVLSGPVMPSMGTNQNATGRNTPKVAVAFNSDQSEKTRSMGEREEQAPTIRAGGEVSVATSMQVRRLTPRECERLQGFPDDYTLIPHRGKPAADGPRYKALGNSMAVPVMRWIGERIALVSARSRSRRAAIQQEKT